MSTPVLSTSELVAAFLESKRRAGMSVRTLERYSGILLKNLAVEHPALPMDPEHLEGFIDAHAGRSPATRWTVYRTLRTFYGFLSRREIIPTAANPIFRVEKPQQRFKLPLALTEAEVLRVVKASKPPYERALILTFLDTGARVGELVNATKADIDGSVLRVSGKTGDRLLLLSPATRDYLLALPTFHLFPSRPTADKPARREALSNRVRRVLKRAGITGEKLGSHRLRHAFATLYLKRAHDLYELARLLGHTSIRMSERYVALDLDHLRLRHQRHSPVRGIYDVDGAAVVDRQATRAGNPFLLPAKCMAVPLVRDGLPVRLGLAAWRNKKLQRTYWRIQAGYGSRKNTFHVVSLGRDLTLDQVDDYRAALAALNANRDRQRDNQAVSA